MGTLGDCFDRYIVRIHEMTESCRILRQCFKQMPDGPVIAKVPRETTKTIEIAGAGR